MKSNNQLALLDVVRSDDVSEIFSKKQQQWPWLVSISDDGHTWEIIDGSGERRNTEKVSMNIDLMDGSNLSHARNKNFYDLLVDYAETFRLFSPDCTACVHVSRIRSLQAFICWLSGHGIRSQRRVKKEHFESYAEHIAYGMEVALQVPDKVFAAVKDAILNNEELPMNSGGVFLRRDVHAMAGTRLIFSEHTKHPYTSNVLKWFENKFKHDFDVSALVDVTVEDVLDDMDAIPTKRTVQDIHRKLLPMEEIWEWQGYMTESSFGLNPYPIGSSKKAAQLGIPAKRTKSIPPKVAFAFLEESVKWVLDYSDTIIDLYNENANPAISELALKKEGLHVRRINDARYLASRKYRTVTVEGLVRMLAASCFAVIAALTARRKEEIFDLGLGCCEPRDDGAFWLTSYIEKTSQRYDLCPVPGVVDKAIKTLERLSKGARKISGSDSLWQYIARDGGVIDLIVTDGLNDLYDFFVLERTGVEWNFTPHQFRRFFALVYYYRYEGAYIGALSYHLRHFNIEMTKRYITDDDFMKEMNEVAEEWSATFLRGVIAGNRKIGGKGGEKIKKKLSDWMRQFRGKVDVVEREHVIQKMARYMKRVGASFQQHVWGTVCSCPTKTSLAKQARCRNEYDLPQFSNGTENMCGECPFSVYTERYADGVDKDIAARRNTQCFSGKDSILNELSGIQIVSLNNIKKSAEAITALEVSDQ